MKSEKIRIWKVILTAVIGLAALAVVILVSLFAINNHIEDAGTFITRAFTTVFLVTGIILIGIHCVSEKKD